MKTSIAIAAYFGPRREDVSEMYNTDCLFFLKKHISILEKIIDKINKIYIVCTHTEPVDIDYINSYFYDIIEKNKKIVILNRPNLGGSYASWHHALGFDNNDSDYMIFVEDDYILTENSIKYMLEYYEETPDMIYLCELWNTNRYVGHGMDVPAHAQISNGMINVNLYNKLKLERDIDFTLYFQPGKEAIYNNQVSFLEQYRINGIVIRDMKEKYSCVYNNDANSVINFCNPSGPDVFMPITKYYPNHHPNMRYNW